jgi:hypothetical protein
MDYLLDIIYSGIFSIEYEDNIGIRMKLARKIEKHRRSDSLEISDDISRENNKK